MLRTNYSSSSQKIYLKDQFKFGVIECISLKLQFNINDVVKKIHKDNQNEVSNSFVGRILKTIWWWAINSYSHRQASLKSGILELKRAIHRIRFLKTVNVEDIVINIHEWIVSRDTHPHISWNLKGERGELKSIYFTTSISLFQASQQIVEAFHIFDQIRLTLKDLSNS